MHALSAAELLAVWGPGRRQRPFERALTLLEAACPESSPESLASLSIGRRDAALLTLREWALGSQMNCLAACRRCHQPLEMTLEVDNLRQSSGDDGPLESSLRIAEYTVRFRPPNSADLVACAGQDMTAIQQQLFSRCVIAAESQSQPIPAEQLPEEVVRTVIEEMAKVDPQAILEIDLCCPACDHRWREAFDIVSFFWSEIDAWARRTLREVHMLAAAYGWPESDILSLSPWRRQLYIEMASE